MPLLIELVLIQTSFVDFHSNLYNCHSNYTSVERMRLNGGHFNFVCFKRQRCFC